MKTFELHKTLAVLSLILFASPVLVGPSLTFTARDHNLASDFCPPLPPPTGNVVNVSTLVSKFA